MDLAKGIIEFNDVEDLITEIKSDKSTKNILANRFPIRLIFLSRFETFRQLIEKLSSIGVENYHLEKELPNPDGWITKDSLIEIVKNIQKDTAIVPFSEIIRFYSNQDFKNFFNQLLLIENDDLCRRIYLPLIGIEERFEKEFYQGFSRKEESAPYWKIIHETPNSIRVFLSKNINSVEKIGNYETIKNADEWLKFWKKRSPCDVICFSKPLNLFYKNTLPDTIFSIDQLANTKDLLEKIFNIEIPILFIESESQYWDRLSNLISNNYTTFTDFVKDYFKVKSLSIKSLLDYWFKTEDTFDKWLLKHYVLSQNCLKKKYLCMVLRSIVDYADHTLLKTLYQEIFNLENYIEYINDRLYLIKQYAHHKPIILCDEVIEELNDNLRSLIDSKQALLLSTGLFQFEKEYIFELFIKGTISDSHLLFERYPEMSYYDSLCTFDNLNDENEWILEYFSEYKKSKLSNSLSSNIKALLSKYNNDEKSFYEWYHSFESIHSIYHSNQVDKVLWIDALGIEWVPFIENYLHQTKKDIKIIKKYIGVSNLPTSTEHNRFSDAKYIQDFDSFIHNNTYSYPDSILNEIDQLKQIIDKYVILDSNQNIAIVSDHGLTALSRLVNSKKYGKDDSHEGRYIEVKESSHASDSDYIVYKSEFDQNNYLIALKYNSLGKKPIREVHGGCTPEEVLVPFIILSNKKDTKELEFSIRIESTDISKKRPIVSLTINPKPIVAFIEFKGKSKRLAFNSETNKWEAKIDTSTSGKNPLKVVVGTTEKSFTINIKSGIIEEDLF